MQQRTLRSSASRASDVPEYDKRNRFGPIVERTGYAFGYEVGVAAFQVRWSSILGESLDLLRNIYVDIRGQTRLSRTVRIHREGMAGPDGC